MFGHNNSLFSQRSGGMLGGAPTGPRQLSLVASEGFSGNGMATIGLDNNFSVIAHLPPPHTLSPYSPAVYAAYLVDGKGKSGFYAGTLKAAGNGMYQTNFRSPVPLIHYNRVVVSLESPQGIGQAPQGPIVMKVKEGFLDGLGPVRKVGGDMWGKVKSFVGSRFGGKTEMVPEQPPLQSMPEYSPVQQRQFPQSPIQQGTYLQQQAGHPQGGYPQQGGYQGGYQYNNYPRGRGLYPQGYSQQRPYIPQQPSFLNQQFSQPRMSPTPPVQSPPPIQQPIQQVQPAQFGGVQAQQVPSQHGAVVTPSDPSPQVLSVEQLPQQPLPAGSDSNVE
jgi:hypothetical protein